MSQRGYSPRRYGRSEHAPIVIDMVDYGGDDFADDFTYSSGHYSSPRPTASIHPSAHPMGSHHSATRHPTGRHGSPRHQRHGGGGVSTSPRHSNGSTPRHANSVSGVPASHGSGHTSPRQPQAPLASPSPPASNSSRQAVHMHNFAQRRSFMMGGFDQRPEDFPHQHPQPPQQAPDVEPNRVYRVENNEDPPIDYDDYPIDNTPITTENEYRQSPGRSRNIRLVDEVDARDRPLPRTTATSSARGRTGNMSRPTTSFGKKHHEQLLDDTPIYGSSFGTSSSRLDSRSHMETTSTRHVQGATIPVFNRMKRPEESVFTFDGAPDNDVHTVAGVINRPRSEGGPTNDGTRESMSVAPASSEKKVFYFDIDDLSQRLLNSGDQDLSRRLRKKKAKNARSRISRNRARRKSKKSVFNLELDSSATSVLHSNDHTVATAPEPQVGASRDSSRGGYGRFDSRSTASHLYIDTSADIDEFASPAKDPSNDARSVRSPSRDEVSSIPIRRNPSVGSPPAEQQTGTLSPDATMDPDGDSIVHDKGKGSVSGAVSPREPSARSPRRESTKQSSPRHGGSVSSSREKLSAEKRSSKSRLAADDNTNVAVSDVSVAKSQSPKHASRISSPSAISTTGADPEADLSLRKANRGAASSEVRVTKVYDDINDRLDHIVKRENDAENRQKAIRAVFEEVQQHVADLRKHKQQGLKGESEDKQEGLVDLVISVAESSKPKRTVTDEGDDQVIKRLNESSDNEDILVKLDKHHGGRATYRPVDTRPKVRSPTIEDMVSPAIAPIAPPSPIAPVIPVIPIIAAVSPPSPPPSTTPSVTVQATSAAIMEASKEVIDVDVQSVTQLNGMKNDDAMREQKASAEADQEVHVIDLEGKDDKKKALVGQMLPASTKGREARPSGYLSSDHSCEDEVVVQQHSIDAADPDGATDVVYVIEEDDGKSVVHIEDKAMLDPPEPEHQIFVTDVEPKDPSDSEIQRINAANAKENRHIEKNRLESPRIDAPHSGSPRMDAPRIESPKNHGLQDDIKSSESRGNEILNCLDEEEDKPHLPLGRPDIGSNSHEDRLEPDGSRLGVDEDEKEAEGSDGDSLANLDVPTDPRVRGHSHKSPKNAKRPTSPKVDGAVLDDTDSEEGVNLDIDKEFERVIPLDKDDTPVNYTIRIDETLDRVARQNELDKKELQKKAREEQAKVGSGRNTPRQEKQKESTSKRSTPATTPTSRRDEDDKANALLDNLSNGSLFSSDHDEAPQPRGTGARESGSNNNTATTTNNNKNYDKKGGNHNDEYVDYDEEDEGIEQVVESRRGKKKGRKAENGVVSLDYDFNLAISAASKSSSTASDLQEFPMSDQHGDGDNYGSGSSNVSSDISESTISGSVTDSSYDSFISIVETEDESDLEFFDEQEGFAENFMSNLVSSTFGWIEKKQEQLVCGFKSGEFDGPSLLRESMTRQKKNEPEEKTRNNKTMKSLRNAVASKYAREGPGLAGSSSVVPEKKKGKESKKSARRAETALEFVEERHKRGKRSETPPRKKSPSPGRSSEEYANKSHDRKKKSSDMVEKPERIKQHMADSRKKSLVDDRKESDSDMSGQAKVTPASDDKRKGSQKKATSSNQHEEITVSTMRTTGTVRTASSKKSDKGTSKSKTKSSSKSTPSNSQYNFDFLSSEDDENVQVVEVRPSAPEPKRVEKEKKVKAKKSEHDDGRKKKSPSTPKPIDVEKVAAKALAANEENHVAALLVSEQIKGKSKRASKQAINKTRPKSPSPPGFRMTQDNGTQPATSKATRRSQSPQRQVNRSPSPRRQKSPNDSNGIPPQPQEKETIVVEKPPKRASSAKVSSTKLSTKASKKASKKEKVPTSKESTSKNSQTASSKRTSSTRASRKSRVSGRPVNPATERRDESESDGDSANHMTEEEREKARKERRRAAALKRRRKLRERRRAKLEQNLTDDTFG